MEPKALNITRGRPKKTTKDLPADWEKLICNMANEGSSEIEIRVKLGCISDDLWYRLKKEDEYFSRVVSEAKLISQAWWEAKGRLNLENKAFNVRLWHLNMMNRFNLIRANEGNQLNCYTCLVREERVKYDL